MNILRKAGTVAAISVAGAGIAVGGIGLASADENTSGQDSTAQTSSPTGEGHGHGHGPGDRGDRGDRGGRGGPGELAPGLAEALGLQESDVTAALESVRGQLESEAPAEGEARTRPTEAEREARQAELASALASELGVLEQQVTDALDSLVVDRMAAGRTLLADRLDTAVADGDLTEADSESVLKAFDAGVLGGGRH